MSVFIGNKNKRVELAERKDAVNPNLLLNSRDFSTNWVISNAEVTNDSYCGGKVVSVHTDGNGSNGLAVSQDIQTPTSQTLTWSVYAKADNAGDKLHTEVDGGGGMTDQAVTTDWCRYTFNGKFSTSKYALYFWGAIGNKGDIHIALPKLEIGNTATPWCPAYDDYVSNSNFNSLQNTVNTIDSTRTPVVTGASGDDLFAFKTSQIRLYNGNGKACKNLPPAANTNYFTVQYLFEGPTDNGIAIYRTPSNEIWTAGCTAASYNTGWVRVANSTDITNLMSMQQTLQTTVSSNQTDIATIKNTLKDSMLVKSCTQAQYDAMTDEQKKSAAWMISDS